MADPNALYSYKGQEPRPLPHEIHYTEAWGGTNFRQGVESFTDEELIKAGYTGPYEMPSFDIRFQKIRWNSENCSYVVEDISDEILWEEIRAERNRRLAECDWTMAADAPKDLNFHEWEMYRQRLRDLPSLYVHPNDIVWPESPAGKSDSDFDQPRVYEDKILWRVRDLEQAVNRLFVEVFPQSVGISSTEV